MSEHDSIHLEAAADTAAPPDVSTPDPGEPGQADCLARYAALDVVARASDGFPVATVLEFGELLRAIGNSGPDARMPTALGHFLIQHAIVWTLLPDHGCAVRAAATAVTFTTTGCTTSKEPPQV
jgi:hypothetical protein